MNRRVKVIRTNNGLFERRRFSVYREVKLESCPISEGIVPVNALPLRSRDCKEKREPSELGMVPDSWL